MSKHVASKHLWGFLGILGHCCWSCMCGRGRGLWLHSQLLVQPFIGLRELWVGCSQLQFQLPASSSQLPVSVPVPVPVPAPISHHPVPAPIPRPSPSPISHLPVPSPSSQFPAPSPSYGTPSLVSPCLPSSSAATFHVCREMHTVKICDITNSIGPKFLQSPAASLVCE